MKLKGNITALTALGSSRVEITARITADASGRYAESLPFCIQVPRRLAAHYTLGDTIRITVTK